MSGNLKKRRLAFAQSRLRLRKLHFYPLKERLAELKVATPERPQEIGYIPLCGGEWLNMMDTDTPTVECPRAMTASSEIRVLTPCSPA
jgi:hypothetical protein